MNIVAFLTDILKYTISGLAVFGALFYVLKSYLDESRTDKLIELKKASQAHTLPLRLQAYERMVLFIERINPAHMLLRLHVSGMSVRELQNLILSDIRSEFQHNTTQQLYMSSRSWSLIKKLKEDTISLVNNVAATMPEHAPSIELSKAILTRLAGIDSNPYESATALIRLDIEALF